MKARVLMITGAYFPELSGGGLQARAVVRALAREVNFSVLTTSTNRALPQRAMEDGIPIRRLYVDLASATSRLSATFRLALAFVTAAWRVDVVNLHGFSRKAILLVALSRVLRKRFILTLQTGVQDEPAAVRGSGRLADWAYRNVDLYLSVSPGLTRAYLDAGLPPQRLRQLSNAVDVERFTPAAPEERRRLRGELGLPQDVPLVLFVGVFSRDKRPDLLYRAWARSAAAGLGGSVVLIGATRPINPDIDATLADAIRAQAIEDGLAQRVLFVETSHEIDRYFRAIDVYVLPSIREGLPIALLEAMSSGLPCVATHLSGSTDVLIEDGTNGLLVAPDDLDGFAGAITRLIQDRELAARLGAAARRTVVDRYSIQATAAAWLAAYNDVAAAAGLATPARGTT